MNRSFAAAVAVAPGVTQIREFERPALSGPCGMLKVEMTGVCGSDWGYYQNLPRVRGALILGHETVGVIAEATAEALAQWGLKEGDRVALEEYIPCGHCEFCRDGDFRLCEATDWRRGGLRYGATEIARAPGLWGGFAQYQYLHPNTVFHRVPAGVSSAHAALALPLANGIEWTVIQGGAKPGDVVVIQGPGQQGLACVAAAKLAGAGLVIITGLDTPNDRRRLEFAKRLGADHAIDIQNSDLLESVAEATNGHMADLVIDCASGGPESVVSAIRLARKKARVILGGQKGAKVPAFDSDQIIAKFLTVRGMRGHGYRSVELALDMIARGANHVTEMSTHGFALAQVDRALKTLVGQGEDAAIHCTVDPWRAP